jgi:hypothetical protein
MSGLALAATGMPEAQPRPSGVSTTIPQIASVAAARSPSIVTPAQRIARANSSGRPDARTAV